MTEIPLMPVWVTLFLTIWAPVGPLIGILIGHYLSRSQQRRQWLADSEVKEWRELLDTMTTSFHTIVWTDKLLPTAGDEIERKRENFRARMLANEVLFNRIFIAHEVAKYSMYPRWRKALDEFDQDHDPAKIGQAFGEINASILKGAIGGIRKV